MTRETWFLEKLRCPASGQELHIDGDTAVSSDGKHTYRITGSGVLRFAEALCSDNGRVQQKHYDNLSGPYIKNLEFRHTRAYLNYLNSSLLSKVDTRRLGEVAEICCGNGSALEFLRSKFHHAIGVDVSCNMLEDARKKYPEENIFFVQADATNLPLKDAGFDSVFVIGGIHHVNDRDKLFSEISRILKPGGSLYWREPVDENIIWKSLRKAVYLLSPNLDAKTERPLSIKETSQQLKKAGLSLKSWQMCGFIAFAMFMNSDVLPFFQVFRYVPGIEKIVRALAGLDDFILSFRVFKNFGFLAIGSAEKIL